MEKVAILGAGAVGSFYGAKLQKFGLKVEYQTSNADTFNNQKLIIKSIWGDFPVKIKAFKNTREMVKADIIIISTKALFTIDFKKLISPVLKAGSIIFVLQNGINFEEKIQELFPDNTVIGGLAFTCINRENANRIVHLDYGLIRMGLLKKQDVLKIESLAKYKNLAQTFQSAGIKISTDSSLRKIRWEKLLWNVPFNPLSVICLGADTSSLINNPKTSELIFKLMFEVRDIAKADGIRIPRKAIYNMVDRTKKMQPYKTSMLLDFENQKIMETEAILGEPLRIASRLKVKTPCMESVYQILSFYNESVNKQEL